MSSDGSNQSSEEAEVPPRDSLSRSQARADELGIDNPPNVAPIREITPDRAGLKVITECMIDKGYPYTFEDGGDVVSIDLSGIDEAQFNLDTYVCEMQYPVEARFLRPLGEREWRILYDHYASTYIPCVEELGYQVENLPSFESYFASIEAGGLPYSPALEVGPQVQIDVEAGRYHSVSEFHQDICPDTVNLDLLYPPAS